MSLARKFAALVARHFQALRYVFTVIVPILLRTGRRPVIFERESGIGDIICTFPAAVELKKRHPGATFIYNCYRDYVDVPRLGGIATRVTSSPAIGLVGHWYRLLLRAFYHFESDDDDPTTPEREIYIKDFGRKFGVALAGTHPHLYPDAASVQRINEILRQHGVDSAPRIIIHPGPTWPVKEWPQQNWAALVEALRQHGFTNIIQLGVGKVLRFGPTAAAEIPHVFSFVDQLSLGETLALISTADLYIGIDSGPLHMAACQRVPAIGLWGFTRPDLRFSDQINQRFMVSPIACQGCHDRIPRLHWYSGCPYDIRCMQLIAVPDVLQACLEHLNTTVSKP